MFKKREPTIGENVLYYGDNVDVLRLHVPDESVDLVYVDPPFKSSRVSNAGIGRARCIARWACSDAAVKER